MPKRPRYSAVVTLVESRRNREQCASPIDRLPDEILEHILGIAIAFIADDLLYYTRSMMGLCRVNWRWRKIVSTTSRLWTNVPLNIPASEQERWCLQFLIKHVRAAQVELCVKFSDCSTMENDPLLFDQVTALFQQCISLRMEGDSSDFVAPHVFDLFQAFPSLPSLQFLAVMGFKPNLTQWYNLLSLLRKSACSLDTLSLTWIDLEQVPIPLSQEEIEMPNLHNLALNSDTFDMLRIHAPALEYLALRDGPGPEPTMQSMLASLTAETDEADCKACFPRLQVLRIACDDPQPLNGAVTAFLNRLPVLQHLTLCNLFSEVPALDSDTESALISPSGFACINSHTIITLFFSSGEDYKIFATLQAILAGATMEEPHVGHVLIDMDCFLEEKQRICPWLEGRATHVECRSVVYHREDLDESLLLTESLV